MRAQRRKRRSSTVVPVLRRGILTRLVPPPGEPGAISILERILARYADELSGVYRKIVAEAAGVGLDSVHVVDQGALEVRKDGKTPMVDLPRLQALGQPAVSFDLRVSFAVCTEADLSSKTWCRIGLPLPASSGIRDLPEGVERFRRIATRAVEWGFEVFDEAVRSETQDIQVDRGQTLEVISLGAVDQSVRELLEASDDPGIHVAELMREPGADERVFRYFDEVARRRLRPGDATSSKTDEPYWFSWPVTVRLPNRELEPRKVLWVLHSENGVTQAIGLGFDDSEEKELAQRSGLKVARWAANQI